MILTDKAKVDFIEWYYKNIHYVGLCDIEHHLNQTINALIIDWFDSVFYFILPDLDDEYNFIYSINYPNDIYFSRWDELIFKTRAEAIEQAIIKANTIYNENRN